MRAERREANLPIWITVSLLSGLLMISLMIQLAMAWQSYQRILPLPKHIAHLERLQSALFDTEESLALTDGQDAAADPAIQSRLQRYLQELLERGNHLAANTPDGLGAALKVLAADTPEPQLRLLQTLKILRGIFREEAAAHGKLTESIAAAAKFEVELGIGITLALPLSAVLLFYLMRRRIFQPLQQMGYMMELLGERRYQQIPLERIDPAFVPIFANYNSMVVRLSELEAEHLQNRQNLELLVEQAAGTLIAQQRNLAQTERFAALGEISARLVHELRNPLAGIKMACINLQQPLQIGEVQPDAAERIGLVIAEIERIISTLNRCLQGANHEPEPLRAVLVDQTVSELLMLARYQLPKSITLEYRGCPGLICRLPDTEFRQALLNLILNAQQAMDGNSGKIAISAATDGRRMTLAVCDDGHGFSGEFLENGIRDFVSRRADGTGLGLSMVKRFVRNLNGEIKLYNRQPHGACVEIILNCIAPHHE
ncbi:ATP-binding protein [Methylomonas koyamae]|uniref:sensor histidine kinase n=1 Tax=Methylomonas koyamae TaxID=702114 RepID=UPI000BC2CB8F|nr:ATP-binding protein [Methylomonas koyamae]ATG91044.1 sensor histidine kinase [Methylomonas koyamae]